MFCDIPANLSDEIDGLDGVVQRYLAGDIDTDFLRIRRVPFGCYEQGQNRTYMLRVRCPGDALTPRQLLAIAALFEMLARNGGEILARVEQTLSRRVPA